MSLSFELAVEVSEQYDFNKAALSEIGENRWVKNQWPLVYFIRNESTNQAYVGESTNALSRIKNHLDNPKKAVLNKISIIGSDKFNKSVTLDIESKLIQYIFAEDIYDLQNGNYGLVNHNYYQQYLYKDLFKEIWSKLKEKNIVKKKLEDIENSELFKYSPYKSLNEAQYNSVLEILEGLGKKDSNRIFVKGSAGTGKTILATYLIKLLNSDISDSDEDYNKDEMLEVNLIRSFKRKYPNAEIGFVVAMSSLRKTLQNVFRKVPDLKSSMIISPSDTFKKKYDLLIVDEAHRLRQYKNIGWMGVFSDNNKKLGLDDTGNELDWILANSKNQIFFYDSAQSVKPSDIDASHFDKLLAKDKLIIELTSQMRVQGKDYISFVDQLLNINRKDLGVYKDDNYELLVFDSMKDLYTQLEIRETKHKLCRLVAGYAWPWSSKENKKAIDIRIDGLEFQWNQVDKDWINSPNAFKEVGCIHTTQGYDLNYTGVIFGEEITYNKKTKEIEIDVTKYYDQNGKKGTDIKNLKQYIINIYKTIMYRGIKGTFIYACDENLREYLKQHIPVYKNEVLPFRILKFEEVKPYVNSVPLVDIYAAAGNFSDLQIHSNFDWIELPFNISAKKGYFVCQVKGESMNKKIPNGSYCLFKQDEGGSRNGKIVLAEHYSIQDSDFGAGYTVKEYHSTKNIESDSWEHETITLKPLSQNPKYQDINIANDQLNTFKIIGIFEKVLY